MIKKILIVTILLLIPCWSEAASFGSKLSGRILLDVERNGEAWYVYPEDNRRYYLGRPADAFRVMRDLGLGISEEKFKTIVPEVVIATSDSTSTAAKVDEGLLKKLSGKIVLQVEKNGEAWYINSTDQKPYYLGRPADAFRIMRELGLGITSEDLAKVHKPGLSESIDEWSKYEHKNINTVDGKFSLDVIEINLDNPNLQVVTDTSNTKDCDAICPADTLAHFVLKNNGFAGINGSYFESYDSAKMNYYFYPVYNSSEEVMINEDELKYWTTGPIMAWDEDNNFYYFKDSREFPVVDWYKKREKSVKDAFKDAYGRELVAAIGNKPRLIEEKLNLLIEWDIDDKQRYTKSVRNAIAYKEVPGSKGVVYLVIANNATVPDLANIMKEMNVDYALNLDGGYSSALWYNDEYMVMPGRDIPNAIIFSTK